MTDIYGSGPRGRRAIAVLLCLGVVLGVSSPAAAKGIPRPAQEWFDDPANAAFVVELATPDLNYSDLDFTSGEVAFTDVYAVAELVPAQFDRATGAFRGSPHLAAVRQFCALVTIAGVPVDVEVCAQQGAGGAYVFLGMAKGGVFRTPRDGETVVDFDPFGRFIVSADGRATAQELHGAYHVPDGIDVSQLAARGAQRLADEKALVEAAPEPLLGLRGGPSLFGSDADATAVWESDVLAAAGPAAPALDAPVVDLAVAVAGGDSNESGRGALLAIAVVMLALAGAGAALWWRRRKAASL